MLKQSPCRIQRSKGFKVKHFLQICLLLAICIWLLNQLKHSYDEKNVYDNHAEKVSEMVEKKYEVLKLGRKDPHPRVDETSLETESQMDKTDLEEEEIEDIKPEDVEDEGRGGGDDEIDGHDQERVEEEESEEVEDLIDVDDRERDGGSEEQESEEKGNRQEDASNHRSQNEGDRISQEAREEHYKGDDASNSVEHKTRTLISEFEIGGLRKIKATLELNKHENVHGEVQDDDFHLADSSFNLESTSPTETAAIEKSEAKLNSRLVLIENSGYQKGKKKLPEINQDSSATTNGEYTFLQTDSSVKDRISNGAIESMQLILR